MSRLNPSVRTTEILLAGVNEAEEKGFQTLTVWDVAERAECSRGLVHNYFKNLETLKTAVMEYAIQSKNLIVLAQGLASGDVTARGAPPDLKKAAANTLA